MRDPLQNISPLDGRYDSKVDDLRPYFSEAALMRYRILVEVEWFIFLSNQIKLDGLKVWRASELKQIRSIYEYFDNVNANRVKAIEKVTNHDVKAIEYFIKENLKDTAFEPYLEFIHFACTSEDINNLAYALMLKDACVHVVGPVTSALLQQLYALAQKYKKVPMMARTHGQPATPTTVGKEFLNTVVRLERQSVQLKTCVANIMGKMNGAVGNFNAHVVAYPKLNWMDISKRFIQNVLQLQVNLYTTQIEPHDYIAELSDVLRRFNMIVMDFDRDVWGYISLGYFKQKLKEGEVGSSTMPHKVNPIDFENSEGNLGLANALLSHFSEKLPISRMQRDLTDSTVLRNMGSALAYAVLAYKSCLQGLNKLDINQDGIADDIDEQWELLAEPIQTVMRRYKIEKPYEKLKALTRGKKVNKKIIQEFIDTLKIPSGEKKRLKNLSPSTYIGLAVELVDSYRPISFK